MTAIPRTGASIIGTQLARAGATHAFGIPGGEVLALMQGMDDAGIRFVLVRHENAGGFFAEGLWHVTGALPVLIATLGPGMANAVNVVANAMQDRVPLIFLTGCVDADIAEHYTHQVFDHQAVLRPLVKGTFRLEKGRIGKTMAEALHLAQQGQKGPVHIDVPIGVAEGWSEELETPASALCTEFPNEEIMGMARQHLATAERPIAIAGVDAVNDGAGPAITAFCQAHGLPLVTTYKGKGLLDETDPLCLGGAGLSPLADGVLLPLIAKADVILLIGYDPIEMRIGWRAPWTNQQAVIEITPQLRNHGMHRVDHVLIGDTASLLKELSHDPLARWPKREFATARESLGHAFQGPERWGPHAVFRTLRQELPAETIATADSGAHRILFSQMWTSTRPRQILQSSGLCTMACAMPLAGGAKLGRPAAPVLCVVGDAGLEMGAGDLATLRDMKLPVIICVLVDQSLALIEMKQRASQRPGLGVTTGQTDFSGLAHAFGGAGESVTNQAELAAAVRTALTRDTFTVIAAVIGERAYDGAF
ncbi:thiamine pyrophosphate-binding protein [Aestuariivirga sp.]|uniref:thiamine pyrophosphate-binding protein n=1 Tax=Aestuariivirga sp. TaxID=2650926 RepID=UPI0035936FCA